MTSRAVAFSLILALAFGVGAAAQQPRLSNAQLTSQPAGSPFAQSFRSLVAAQNDPAWIGYAVPVVDGHRVMCCFDSGSTMVNGTMVVSNGQGCCGACSLEPSTEGRSITVQGSRPTGPIKLEGSDQMIVLFRVAARRVEKVRIFSEECALDAGGRAVRWLESVRPADSIALLESLVTADADRSVNDGAISAIALHRDPAADGALDRLIAVGQPEVVRRKVTFWLGNARGRHGLEALKRVLKDDPSPAVRKAAVFGISQSTEPDAVDTLIATSRTAADTSTRGEAIFWLGQKAGAKAAAAITERIEQDPDTEIKKKAVFALSQMPKDEGVPLLINVARTNSNPAVRKQAMFWLGQSRDPRAIDFFAEVLGK
jgi:HEAT repeat protein